MWRPSRAGVGGRRLWERLLGKLGLAMSEYPEIVRSSFGEITVGKETCHRDIYILADGRVRERDTALAKKRYGSSHKIGPAELETLCQDGPEVVFIGTGQSGLAELTDEGRQFLRQRGIECKAMPTPQAVEGYNSSKRPKAALIHVTC